MLWMLLAASSPTYLSCSLLENGVPAPVDVVVNEGAQQAVISLPSGRTATRQAAITPTSVRIPDEESVWTIDRVTLAFGRKVVIGEQAWDYRGKCEVTPAPPKRAF